MNKRIIFSMAVISLLFFSFRTNSGVVGNLFPDISGITLDDKKISVPNNTKGKSTIIALAYSQDAEKELGTWTEPAYDKFIGKTEIMSYDVNLYFIPMFSGAKASLAESAREKFKKENDPQLYPYVLIYKGDIEQYKNTLQMSKKESPYIFVLDKDGKIVYATSGAYTEAKMDEIEDHLE
ncbi:MAG TPA: hypothetical protein VI112_03110 [Bacteroidia bacterium]